MKGKEEEASGGILGRGGEAGPRRPVSSSRPSGFVGVWGCWGCGGLGVWESSLCLTMDNWRRTHAAALTGELPFTSEVIY